VLVVFKQALQACDAVWLIAPETAGILLELTALVEKSGRLLLSSPASAVAKTADKFQTFQILTKQAIPTVATQLLSTYNGLFLQEKVIKPRDGVSCEECFFIQNNTEMNQVLTQILRPQSYIVQPYISGETLSISALFKHGMAQLICVNRQQVELKQQNFKLLACEVNIEANKVRLQILLKQIARAFPDLWGYVGIDLIKQHQQFLVLEINPRLTTSYTGIKQALGINTAQAVLQLVNGQAYLNPTCNQTVTVAIAEENSDVI
jgi:predicted ATP-grasp superfamily ATP-dependent carboligase